MQSCTSFFVIENWIIIFHSASGCFFCLSFETEAHSFAKYKFLHSSTLFQDKWKIEKWNSFNFFPHFRKPNFCIMFSQMLSISDIYSFHAFQGSRSSIQNKIPIQTKTGQKLLRISYTSYVFQFHWRYIFSRFFYLGYNFAIMFTNWFKLKDTALTEVK